MASFFSALFAILCCIFSFVTKFIQRIQTFVHFKNHITSATAITADELIDLFYSLNSAYRKNAVWLLNDSTMKNIRKLKDSNGQYLWQPALHEGGFDTLLGKRIYTSPYAPELAAGQKTVAFGDFNYYWIGDRLGITFKRLNERFAETGQIGFIASKRLDGKLILPEAIKVLQQKGSASSGG